MLEADHDRAVTLRSEGNANIDVEDGLSEEFVVLGVRIHYADIKTGGGASTTTADVTISLVSEKDTDHNVDLRIVASRGIGADMNLQIDPALWEAWRFDARDRVKIAWTNPDAPNIGYAIALRVAPILRTRRVPS